MSFADSAYNLRKQLMWAGVALAGMIIAMHADYRRLSKLAPAMLGISILMLALVLVPGVGYRVGGARRWFRLGFVSFQPTEFAKLSVVLFAAWYAGGRGEALKSFWKGFLPAAAAIGTVAGLILVEPDLGSAMFVGTIGMGVLLVAGIRLVHLVPLVAAGVPVVAYVMITRFHHVQRRIEAFLNPDADVLGIGHQVHQSLIGLGSGGMFGAGLGHGKQKLAFLPAGPTDFIFSHIGEELGFAGTCVVVLMFMALVAAGIRIARRAPDSAGFLLAFGIVFSIGLQAVINFAVVTGSVPPKGIALPFVSFGGSGLLFHMISIGILLNIARSAREKEQPLTEKENESTQ